MQSSPHHNQIDTKFYTKGAVCMVQKVPNLLLLEAAMVIVSGDASGVIEDPYRFL